MQEIVNGLEVSDYISIGACLISVIAARAASDSEYQAKLLRKLGYNGNILLSKVQRNNSCNVSKNDCNLKSI